MRKNKAIENERKKEIKSGQKKLAIFFKQYQQVKSVNLEDDEKSNGSSSVFKNKRYSKN